MKKTYILLLTAFSSFGAFNAFSQCPAGQADVTVDVATDSWGYECYWDVTPTGAGCGTGTLFGPFGNTTEIDCAGGGLQVATGGGYGDNMTTNEPLGCIVIGTCLDINYVDDYGDGGATFTVNVNGIAQTPQVGGGNGNVFNFCVTAPAVNDVDMMASGAEYTKIPLSQAGIIGASGDIASLGSGNVTGATMTVTIMNGAATVYTATSAAQSITSGNSANFTVAGYTPVATGVYTITYTSDITETDEDLSNNVWVATVEITDSAYARDNGTMAGPIGIGAGEVGYLGNEFDINSAANITSVSVFISNSTGNITDSLFTVEVFTADATGMPLVSVASATGTVTATPDQWYTVNLTPALAVTPGKYVVALKEDTYQQQIGLSTDIFTVGSSWVSWVSQPWTNIETFSIMQTFMIRANVMDDSGISEITQNSLEVYPNPAQTELNISTVENGTVVEIYNNVGQVVLSTVATGAMTTVNVSEFTNGMYTVKTLNGSAVSVAKFIKK